MGAILSLPGRGDGRGGRGLLEHSGVWTCAEGRLSEDAQVKEGRECERGAALCEADRESAQTEAAAERSKEERRA